MIRHCLQGLLLLSLLFSQLASAQLTIRIDQGVDNPVPIAIVPFEWTGYGDLPENITDIINNDLSYSGEFAPMDESNMLSMPHEQKNVFFRDWSFLGTDYLLVGKITRSNNSDLIEVQYELFNVFRETRMIGELISGTTSQLRDIAHQISDVIFQQVTGVRGAFATKILYITEQRFSAEQSSYQLNMSDADGGRPIVLFESPEPIVSPAWSPDGKKVAYASFESSRPRIYIQDIVLGTREQITDFPGLNSAPAWSPDGTKMAMVLSKDGSADIYVMDLRTRELTAVTNNYVVDTEPSWLPDGSGLLFTSEQGGSFRPQIYQVDLDTLWSERVTFEGSSNSMGIMLEDGENMIMIHRYDTRDNYHLAIQNLKRGTIRLLTNTTLDESPTVAPNASMVMYASKENGRGVLNAVSIDGKVKIQLPVQNGEVRYPAWSPFMD